MINCAAVWVTIHYLTFWADRRRFSGNLRSFTFFVDVFARLVVVKRGFTCFYKAWPPLPISVWICLIPVPPVSNLDSPYTHANLSWKFRWYTVLTPRRPKLLIWLGVWGAPPPQEKVILVDKQLSFYSTFWSDPIFMPKLANTWQRRLHHTF